MKIKNKKFKKIHIVVLIVLVLILGYFISNNQSNSVRKIQNNDSGLQTESVSKNNDIQVNGTATDNNDKLEGDINITISTIGQDAEGGDLIIRTILPVNGSGKCSYELSNQGIVRTYSSEVIFTGTYYSCNYNVPYSDLSNNTWSYKIMVITGKNTGYSYGIVQING